MQRLSWGCVVPMVLIGEQNGKILPMLIGMAWNLIPWCLVFSLNPPLLIINTSLCNRQKELDWLVLYIVLTVSTCVEPIPHMTNHTNNYVVWVAPTPTCFMCQHYIGINLSSCIRQSQLGSLYLWSELWSDWFI